MYLHWAKFVSNGRAWDTISELQDGRMQIQKMLSIEFLVRRLSNTDHIHLHASHKFVLI